MSYHILYSFFVGRMAAGPGKSVAWHSSLHRFAVLHDDDPAIVAAAAAAAADAKKGKGSSGTGKTKRGKSDVVDRSLSSASNVPAKVEVRANFTRSVGYKGFLNSFLSVSSSQCLPLSVPVSSLLT
jgi:hypothetical protein